MNTSGMKPINCNVLVKPDDVEEKKGGIFLPDEVRERDQHAQTRGVLVDMCPDAFQEMDEKPAVGSRVVFAKYEGVAFDGDDGVTYRLLKDIDVVGLELSPELYAVGAA